MLYVNFELYNVIHGYNLYKIKSGMCKDRYIILRKCDVVIIDNISTVIVHTIPYENIVFKSIIKEELSKYLKLCSYVNYKLNRLLCEKIEYKNKYLKNVRTIIDHNKNKWYIKYNKIILSIKNNNYEFMKSDSNKIITCLIDEASTKFNYYMYKVESKEIQLNSYIQNMVI